MQDVLKGQVGSHRGEAASTPWGVPGGDGAAFTEAFRHAVLVHGEDVEKRAMLFTTPVTRCAPRRAIWLEGLALLRLAERVGIAPTGAGLHTREGARHLVAPPGPRPGRRGPDAGGKHRPYR